MINAYNHKLIARARKLRNNSTLSEVILWRYLKNRQIMGYKFLRQKIIGNYVVDFFCPLLGLVIEIDGTSHTNKKDYDKFREEFLNLSGLKVLRFSDLDIKSNVEGVIRKIEDGITKNAIVRILL